MIMHPEDWEGFINHSDDHANPIIPGPYGQFKVSSGKKLKPLKQIEKELKLRAIEELEA